MSQPVIRAALPSDEATWRQLWRAYCEFYRAHLDQYVPATGQQVATL